MDKYTVRKSDYKGILTLLYKAILLLTYIFFFIPEVNGQTSSRNYVMTRTMLDSLGATWSVTVTYTDKYGRPTQKVTSSESGHIAVMTEYDGAGREWRRWLPVPSSYSAPNAVFSFYETSLDTYGHEYTTEDTQYDPLGRPTRILGAGEEWYDENTPERRVYRVNSASSVRKYSAPLNEVSLVKDGFYPEGTLSSVLVTDEDGHTTEIFTDVLGRTILERNAGENDTYYVYNDIGQLRYVLPPQYQENQTKALFAYDYRYNEHRQLEKKKLPGCENEQYWYDYPSDRIRFMQNAVLREVEKSRFWLYDPIGRPVVQGTCTYGNHGQYEVTARYGQGGTAVMGTGYRINKSNFASGMSLEIAHYYDNYDFLSSPIVNETGYSNLLEKVNPCNAKGLETGTVEIASNGDTIVTSNYYDWRGRLEQQRRCNSGGTLTVITWKRSFTGQVTKETTTVTLAGGVTHMAVIEHGLSHRTGQPVSTTVTTDGRTQRTSLLSFDNIGRIANEQRGGDAGAIAYEYNTRGWKTGISSSHFSENIHYVDGSGHPRYNGDISSLTWMAADSVTRGYRFNYDSMGRMTEAIYGEGTGILGDQKYSEKVNYNKNGSPTLVERNATYGAQAALAERIALRYNGNQLISANKTAGFTSPVYGRICFSDNSTMLSGEYAYDGCGQMAFDRNKEVTHIGYDLMGNLMRVQFVEGNTLEYSYTPGGQKLRTVVRNAYGDLLREDAYGHYIPLTEEETASVDSTVYCGPFVIRNGRPDLLLFPGGYCTLLGSGQVVYHYFMCDHLGNVRNVTGEDGTVEQETHYYPFGTVIYDLSTSPGVQPWKYNGKELDANHGLNWYDYGARWYDPVLCIWNKIDPLCEKYYGWTPYGYCLDNPTNYIDLDGRSTWVISLGDGCYQVVGGNINDNDKNIYVGYFNKSKVFVRIRSIGITTSLTSFYNSDVNGGTWQTQSIINTHDTSGDLFLTKIIGNNPPLFDDYIRKARDGRTYDFKLTNGTNKVIKGIDIYRGMPIGITGRGQTIFSSARDIGNMAAGYVAARNGMTWGLSRLAFDLYQGGIEGESTRNAEYYGWLMGYNNTSNNQKANNFKQSVFSLIRAILKNYF